MVHLISHAGMHIFCDEFAKLMTIHGIHTDGALSVFTLMNGTSNLISIFKPLLEDYSFLSRAVETKVCLAAGYAAFLVPTRFIISIILEK
jgi:hypothetical protein